MAEYEPTDLNMALEKAKLIESIESTDDQESLVIQDNAVASGDVDSTLSVKNMLKELLEEQALAQEKRVMSDEIEELRKINCELQSNLANK